MDDTTASSRTTLTTTDIFWHEYKPYVSLVGTPRIEDDEAAEANKNGDNNNNNNNDDVVKQEQDDPLVAGPGNDEGAMLALVGEEGDGTPNIPEYMSSKGNSGSSRIRHNRSPKGGVCNDSFENLVGGPEQQQGDAQYSSRVNRPTRPSNRNNNSNARRSKRTHENFFFCRESTNAIGVGTVGLYADKAQPVYVRDEPDGSQHPFYTTASYVARPPGAEDPNITRQRHYQTWRDDKLHKSLYYALTRSESAPDNHHYMDGMSDFSGRSRRTHNPHEKDEINRLRALAAERRKKESKRAESSRDMIAETLDRRRRALRGEALDLPDAYYTTVTCVERMLDPTKPLAPLDRDAITAPVHHKAVRTHQTLVTNARIQREEEIQESCARDKERRKQELSAMREGDREFRQKRVEGLPRLSRAELNDRSERTNAENAQKGRLGRAERDLRRQQAKETVEAEVETTVAASRARRGLPMKTPLDTAQSTSGDNNNYSNNSNANASAKAAATTADAQPAMTSTDPHVFATTTTNFFAEVKSWKKSFQSPLKPLPSGGDASHRRQWLTELEAERAEFNNNAVASHRAVYPQRVLEARSDNYVDKQKTADDGRAASAQCRQQRADNVAASRARNGVLHDRSAAQPERVREVQHQCAEDRRRAAENQRLDRIEMEATIASCEEAELKRLREVVAAANS